MHTLVAQAATLMMTHLIYLSFRNDNYSARYVHYVHSDAQRVTGFHADVIRNPETFVMKITTHADASQRTLMHHNAR
jgi:hypothetical protein